MEEIYSKLNIYLNDMCNYMYKEEPFLINNIEYIARLNDSILDYLKGVSLDSEQKIENHLTFDDVYKIAREIIETIDKSYLESYDNLIQSGELDFGYEDDDNYKSICMYLNKDVKLINVKRRFNYHDVIVLVHEFIHYTNAKNFSLNRYYLTEFLSIYFELYATRYLINKGINKEELDTLFRVRSIRYHSKMINRYEIILLAYVKFGNIDDDTVYWLQKYFLDIKKETFEEECKEFYKLLEKIKEKIEREEREKIEKNPKIIGKLLSKKFITVDYRYMLGSILAIYALNNCSFKDIVNLNNNIDLYDGKSIYDILLSIGIDLDDKDLAKKMIFELDEFINEMRLEHGKVV